MAAFLLILIRRQPVLWNSGVASLLLSVSTRCTLNNQYIFVQLFTALHVMQTQSSDENSVCPSVCPSVRHTRVL